ncbi:MAG: GNAT family N-acetyltransferase [Chloroflexaceae bacterium]|jgi:GNAT superfamily N-acetyltransferase|nr:GNAT family N-acetyltransferase [Chloroflexaceae bacterium]
MSAALLPLSPHHLSAAATLLTDAFADDVGMRAICTGKTETHERQALTAWFLATLRLQLATGQPAWVVVAGGEIVGLALATFQRGPFAFGAWLRWVVAVGLRCGWAVVGRTARHERQRQGYRPARPHVVLEFIAVHQGYRGHGHAARLLEEVRQWSHMQPASVGIWLETTRPPNLAFFRRFGYRLTGHMALQQGAAYFLYHAHE